MFVKGTELAENFLSHEIPGEILFFTEVDNKSYGDAGSRSCEMKCFFSFRQNQNLSLIRTKNTAKNVISFGYCYKGQIKNQDLVFLFCR